MKLLDTEICIHLLNGREPALVEKFRAHAPLELALSSGVRAELLYATLVSRNQREFQRVDGLRLEVW